MLFSELADVSSRVADTASRSEKTAILAEAVGRMLNDEVAIGVSYLAGVVPQGRLGIGYASLQALPSPAAQPTLTLQQVDDELAVLAALSGPGSSATRQKLLGRLVADMTMTEQEFFTSLLVGGLRQGANERLMMDAVAKSMGVPAKLIRRAVMFAGDIGEVAVAAVAGREAVEAIGLRLFRPVQPMLAKTASSVPDGIESLGEAVVERKLDGARIQVHLSDGEVRAYTRNLNEVTERLPEVVAAVAEFRATSLVLDGEAIALRPDGRPQPFQVTMGRFGSETEKAAVALTPFFFDVLHVDGQDCFDMPFAARSEMLANAIPDQYRVPRLTTSDPAAGQAFFDETIAAGHEGVILKSLDDPYEAGKRGSGWLKVKPVHTLDLVVLAVEWGSGRRQGWLSNIHLGARSDDGFVMLGKTFKGMTDKMLEWQTERFLELETHRKGRVVYVKPEQVVEIAFDGIQASSRYPGGMALRFARVKGYREDKTADEADTIETVRGIFGSQ